MSLPRYQQPSIAPGAGGDMFKADNLSGLGSYPTARVNMGVPSNSEVLARQWSAQGHVRFGSSGQYLSAFVPGMNHGTNDFAFKVRFRVPLTTPISTAYVLLITTDATGAAAAGSFLVTINTSGEMWFRLYSGTSSSEYRYKPIASFVTTYAGQEIELTGVRTSGAITAFVNKVSVTFAAEATNGATSPASFAETILGQYMSFGSGLPEHIVSGDIYNRALPATGEGSVAELVDFGTKLADRPWPANTAYGMNMVANIERNSVFSAATSDWSAVATGTPTISAGVLSTVAAAGGDGCQLISTYTTQLKAGQLHRIAFTIGSVGTCAAIDAYWDAQLLNPAGMTAAGNYWYEFTPVTGVGTLKFVATDAGTFTLDDIVLSPVLLTNGSFETAGSGGADVFANWTESATVGGSVNDDTAVLHGGAHSCRLDYVTGGTCNVSETILRVGQKYRLSVWIRQNTGDTKTSFVLYGPVVSGSVYTVTNDYTGAALSIPTDTWTRVIFDFTALSTQFGLIGASANPGNGFSIWFDDVELIPLGNIASFSPRGLDNRTTCWWNEAGSGDGTLFGMTLDTASGTYPNIVLGQARSWALDYTTQNSRERRALVGGGIYFPGGAGQAATSVPSTAQDLDVGAFWFQWSGDIPLANPASTAGGLFLISSSLTTTAAACVNAGIDTSGNLLIRVYGSSTSNYRQAQISNIVSMYGGKVLTLIGCRTATGLQLWTNGGTPVAYIESVAGTPPTWAADITSTNFHFGLAASGQRTLGNVYLFRIGRGTLTQAFVDELISTGLRIASGSAISKGGSFSGSTDGCVFDANCAEGGGNEFQGRSGNNFHFFSFLTTHTHLNPKVTGLVLKDTLVWAGGSHEAKSIGGTAVTGGVLLPLNAIIRSITLNASAASINGITVGDGTAADKYVALAAMAIGYNTYTLATGKPDGTHQAVFVDPDTANIATTINATVVYDLVQ